MNPSELHRPEVRDTAAEFWLRKEVVAAYDALEAGPGRAVSAREVFAAVSARPRERR
jgi:hypothetical protein